MGQGTGGGGFLSGAGAFELGPAVAQGYSAASTDGGNLGDATGFGLNPSAFTSDYQVIPGIFEDYVYRSVHDMAVIGKAVTASYYGKPPKFSYWNGCSTGGRQGVGEAQLYPNDFDGIMAGAPAINLPKTLMTIEWPYVVMVCWTLRFLYNNLRNDTFPITHFGVLLKNFSNSHTDLFNRTTRKAFQANASSTHSSTPVLPNVTV